jgi:hypothetical protein
LLIAALGLLPIVARPVGAAEGDLSLHLLAEVSPFLRGDAGKGSGAPRYQDIFETGQGGSVEIAYRPGQRFSYLLGVSQEYRHGETFREIAFSNRKATMIFGGIKVHCAGKASPWNPFLRADAGAVHASRITASYQNFESTYWESSWRFLLALGAGIEYRYGNWGASLEVKARYLDGPAASLGRASRPEASLSVPITAGIAYYFNRNDFKW